MKLLQFQKMQLFLIEKKVKTSTLLKNYKLVKEVEVEEDPNNEEGIKIANELKKHPEIFSGAVRYLVSKKRINYIDSICQDLRGFEGPLQKII